MSKRVLVEYQQNKTITNNNKTVYKPYATKEVMKQT